MPDIIRFDGEEVTEGFYFFFLCGKPVIVVYDTDRQMAVPTFGQSLVRVFQDQAWALEDGPPAAIMPDLAEIYPPLREACDVINAADRKIQRDNEPIKQPKTQMK